VLRCPDVVARIVDHLAPACFNRNRNKREFI
jgi:hypothetical protein